MSDFADRQTEYTEQSGGGASDGYTRIWWLNGEARDNTPGRFWTMPDNLADAGISFDKPWKMINHTFKDGAKKDILVAAALRIAPICWRQQNFVKDASGGVESWIAERKRGKLPEGQGVAFEMLALVEGLSEPVVINTKGITTSMAWLVEILPEYRKLRDEVKKSRGTASDIPPWWFWLAIRSELDADKKPVYRKTPGTPVTPPLWIHGDITSRDTWKAMYVGNDNADAGDRAYFQDGGREWAQRLIGDGAAPAAVPAGRNVPQPVEEDGVPF